LCPLEYRGCATPEGWVTPKKLVFLGVLGLKKLCRPTVLIGLCWFLVILYNAWILKFSQAIFCNFHLEPKLWHHKWRNFRFCKSCRRAMPFSPLDSSDDFMRQCGLRFCISLIVSELWRHFHVCESCRRAMRIAPPAVNHLSVAASSQSPCRDLFGPLPTWSVRRGRQVKQK